MVMKKASGMISSLRQDAEKSFRSPRSRDDGGPLVFGVNQFAVLEHLLLHHGAVVGVVVSEPLLGVARNCISWLRLRT